MHIKRYSRKELNIQRLFVTLIEAIRLPKNIVLAVNQERFTSP